MGDDEREHGHEGVLGLNPKSHIMGGDREWSPWHYRWKTELVSQGKDGGSKGSKGDEVSTAVKKGEAAARVCGGTNVASY